VYDGEIAYADFAVGSLIAHLQRAGIYKNSIINCGRRSRRRTG